MPRRCENAGVIESSSIEQTTIAGIALPDVHIALNTDKTQRFLIRVPVQVATMDVLQFHATLIIASNSMNHFHRCLQMSNSINGVINLLINPSRIPG